MPLAPRPAEHTSARPAILLSSGVVMANDRVLHVTAHSTFLSIISNNDTTAALVDKEGGEEFRRSSRATAASVLEQCFNTPTHLFLPIDSTADSFVTSVRINNVIPRGISRAVEDLRCGPFECIPTRRLSSLSLWPLIQTSSHPSLQDGTSETLLDCRGGALSMACYD